MKYLLPLLILSLLFSQELEVEGDLKVTGTVESATIDSLEQVIANLRDEMYDHIDTMNAYHLSEIADLQAQIDSMHADNQLETRVYTIENYSFTSNAELNINDITGYELEYALVKIVNITNISIDVSSSWFCPMIDGTQFCNYTQRGYIYQDGSWHTDGDYYATRGTGTFGWKHLNGNVSANISIAITAQFPD